MLAKCRLAHTAMGIALLLLIAVLSVFALGSRVRPPPSLMIPTSVLALDRHGALLHAQPIADGRWRLPVTLKAVDPLFIELLLMWEDRRFRQHLGVDWAALGRALLQWLRHGRIVSGGSTLTMQLARRLETAHTRSLSGKGRQILTALALERQAGKDTILRSYLQYAGYGGNLEGVRSASLAYFGKEPQRLTLAEAALLVALPQSPERRRPDRHPQAATRARNRILTRALTLGLIRADHARQAMAVPVPTRRHALPRLAAHRVTHWAMRQSEARILPLTLSVRHQRALERLAQQRVSAFAPPVSIAMLAAEHDSGEVLAAVGSAGYTDVERAGFVDMTEAVRSPGSTLKPLIYGLAFELGLAHPDTLIEDRPQGFGHYAPANFSGEFAGTLSVREALRQSLNVPAVALLEAVGPARLLARLRRAGIEAHIPGQRPPGLAIALGGLGLTLHDLVTLYGAIARGGMPVPLREWRAAIPSILPKQQPLLTPAAAWQVTSILAGADAIAIKTGTAYGYRDAWAIGFDGRHVIGVWVGRPDGAPVPGLTGADAAVPILRDAFARFGPPTPLPPAPPGVLQVSTGQLPGPLRRFAAGPSGQSASRVQIAYPPDGAHIDLGCAQKSDSCSELILKARGGQPPFTWILNGHALPSTPYAPSSRWPPDGSGFTNILLIDGAGQRARARISIE